MHEARALGAGLVCCVLCCALAVEPLGAQQTGTSVLVAGVADAETGQALEGAEVLLVGLHRLARANGMGEAILAGVPRGVQHVRVRYLGYTPAEVDLAFTSDTTGAVFRLPRAAMNLGEVKVTAEWMPPKMKDVAVRMKQGIGRFLTDEELAKDQDREFALTATTRFPGLTTVPDGLGHQLVASRRSAGVSVCLVQIYLDGILLGQDSDLVRTWDLATVEYYTGSQVPVRYRTGAYGCGVLLLWSKWY